MLSIDVHPCCIWSLVFSGGTLVSNGSLERLRKCPVAESKTVVRDSYIVVLQQSFPQV